MVPVLTAIPVLEETIVSLSYSNWTSDGILFQAKGGLVIGEKLKMEELFEKEIRTKGRIKGLPCCSNF